MGIWKIRRKLEGNIRENAMNKILIMINYDVGLYRFRKELLEELSKRYEVYISLPFGSFIPKLEKLGCTCIETPIDRRGTNPATDLGLFIKYYKIINKLKPMVVLTYTIKPNIYGGLACRLLRVPQIASITGLGSAIEKRGLFQKLTLWLYKTSLKDSKCVFFQNKENQRFFIENNIIGGNYKLVPGSGVNLDEYSLQEYPPDDGTIRFLFIARIMKEKGIEEYISAAKTIKKNYANTEFHIIGFIEEKKYKDIIKYAQKEGIVIYHGIRNDIHTFLKNIHATILPSYHEGMSNVLLESASTGRPVIASRISGCIETFDEGISGFGFNVKDTVSLITAIEKFIKLPYEKKKEMGLAGRRKMEQEFDRRIVIDAYMREIFRLLNKESFYDLQKDN